jgi:DNA-binding MarR family transcriptional regulator
MADKREHAEQVMEVCGDAIRLFFRLQAWGRELGMLTATDGSRWGMLNTLVNIGPMTVPDIARMRPVSRQHIQSLANEMADEGLVTFAENPRHKRSKLVKATAKGRKMFRDQTEVLMREAESLAVGLSTADLAAAHKTLTEIRKSIEAHQAAIAD